MVLRDYNFGNITINIDGVVKTQVSVSESKFRGGEFFMLGKMVSISASFEFECTFKFIEDQSQFLIKKITGICEDENRVEEVYDIDQIVDDDEDDQQLSLWNHFNILFMTLFGLQEVELVW